jgi:hypothetical protein
MILLGLISREEAEERLANSPKGTFLVRISDRVWGYALSYRSDDTCKHYLIDASDGRYRFFGTNQMVHNSLDDLVDYHKVSEVIRCVLTFSKFDVAKPSLLHTVSFQHHVAYVRVIWNYDETPRQVMLSITFGHCV